MTASRPSSQSHAATKVTGCMSSGFPHSGASASPVSDRDSAPVTYSVPDKGSSSPVSVPSRKYFPISFVSVISSLPSSFDFFRARRRCGSDLFPPRRKQRGPDTESGAFRSPKRAKHLFEKGQSKFRRMRKPGNRRTARAKIRLILEFVRNKRMVSVPGAHLIPVSAISRRAPRRLNIFMLVRRHGLIGQLPADPVGLFGKNATFALGTGAVRRQRSAQRRTDHDNIRSPFIHVHTTSDMRPPAPRSCRANSLPRENVSFAGAAGAKAPPNRRRRHRKSSVHTVARDTPFPSLRQADPTILRQSGGFAAKFR